MNLEKLYDDNGMFLYNTDDYKTINGKLYFLIDNNLKDFFTCQLLSLLFKMSNKIYENPINKQRELYSMYLDFETKAKESKTFLEISFSFIDRDIIQDNYYLEVYEFLKNIIFNILFDEQNLKDAKRKLIADRRHVYSIIKNYINKLYHEQTFSNSKIAYTYTSDINKLIDEINSISLEDIKNMNNKLILENSFYRGLIVGNMDVQEFESFRKFIPFKSKMESLDFTDEIPIKKDDIEIPDNKIKESFIYITYTTKKDSYAIINILNSILNSRELCLQIIREKYKIAYHAEAYFKYSNNSIIFFGQISKENKEKFIAAVNEIIDIIQDEQKLKKLILDGKENLKENYFLISERKNILIDNLANYILNSNGDYSYEDLIKNLDFYDEKRIVEYTKSFERQSTFMYRGDK